MAGGTGGSRWGSKTTAPLTVVTAAASTETEVTNKVRELERKRDAGLPGKAGKPLTVADWFQIWLTTIAPRTVSQRTLDQHLRAEGQALDSSPAGQAPA